jgi:hypothetical protein
VTSSFRLLLLALPRAVAVSEPDGVRAPDLWDYYEVSERMYAILNFLKDRIDMIHPNELRREVFQAALHLEDAARTIGRAVEMCGGSKAER